MALRLIYRIFVTFVSWMVLQARPDTAKEIEILVEVVSVFVEVEVAVPHLRPAVR